MKKLAVSILVILSVAVLSACQPKNLSIASLQDVFAFEAASATELLAQSMSTTVIDSMIYENTGNPTSADSVSYTQVSTPHSKLSNDLSLLNNYLMTIQQFLKNDYTLAIDTSISDRSEYDSLTNFQLTDLFGNIVTYQLYMKDLTNSASSTGNPTTSGVTTTLTPPTTSSSTTTTQRTFTLSELATYNGDSGSLAYIAVSGIVYDVTHASGWTNGWHRGIHIAGTDATSVFASSPHSETLLNSLPVVGVLASPTLTGLPFSNDLYSSRGNNAFVFPDSFDSQIVYGFSGMLIANGSTYFLEGKQIQVNGEDQFILRAFTNELNVVSVKYATDTDSQKKYFYDLTLDGSLVSSSVVQISSDAEALSVQLNYIQGSNSGNYQFRLITIGNQTQVNVAYAISDGATYSEDGKLIIVANYDSITNAVSYDYYITIDQLQSITDPSQDTSTTDPSTGTGSNEEDDDSSESDDDSEDREDEDDDDQDEHHYDQEDDEDEDEFDD